MSTGSDGRLPIGQLLGNLQRLFRAELATRGTGLDAVTGIRPAHLQVFGSIKADGTRLTDLAGWANVSLSSMAELVDDLEQLGYLERRPDPLDGRAKLVCLTDAGWQAIRQGRRIISQIEADWARRLGEARFERLCEDLEALLDALDPQLRQTYVAPPLETAAADGAAET
jgi:DNA-binding MarR family transcriptional regulator